MKRHPFRLLLAWGLATAFVPGIRAQDFRVEADVFVDGSDDSVSETLTLFKGDFIYDFFVKGPEETTVFDMRRGRIVLLDSTRQVQTVLTTDQLLQLSEAIQSAGSDKHDEALFRPHFTTEFDAATGTLQMASQRLTYRAKSAPPKWADGAERYRQFADWYARLNAIRPGNPPPFGRIELNRELAQRGLVPAEIERTVVLDRPLSSKTLQARSRQIFVWTLSGTDEKRIEKAAQQMAGFNHVTLGQYWQSPR